MIDKIYRTYTKLFSHGKILNYVINTYSDSQKNIHKSAHIGRGTQLYGDINIASNVDLSKYCYLSGNIDIGSGTNINGRNKIIGEISIGKYCAIAPRARMRTKDHPTGRPALSLGFYDDIGSNMNQISTDCINIGNDVWICSDAKILAGVTVGDGAIIAADSVVVDDVEPYSLVAGNPAQHKKYRFDAKTRDDLIQLQWWDWSDEKKRKNKNFFETDLRQVDDINSIIS
jgi:virginiamycin A acetyltransferase